MDNFDTVLTTSNTYQAAGMEFGYAGNLALNYSTIAFGPSTVRGATIPYTFSGAVQAPQVSSMNVNLSSINGWAFSDILNPGFVYSTFSNIYLTPAKGFGINMSTGAVGGTFGSISSISACVLKTSMSFQTTEQAFIAFTPPTMNISPSNIGIWASTIVNINTAATPGTSNVVNLNLLGGLTGQVDVCNTSGETTWLKGGILGAIPNNAWRRFTNNGSGWIQNFSPTPQSANYTTQLNLYQKWDGTYLQTDDYLYVSTGTTTFDGDVYVDQLYASNIDLQGGGFATLNASLATISTASISNLTTCNANIFRINGGTFYSAEVGTNVVSDFFTMSTAFTNIGLTQFRDNYNSVNDNLVPVRLFRSQMSYSNYPGWNGTYNSISNAYINSNGDVYLNGNPNTVSRNFNILSAVVTLNMINSGPPYNYEPSLYFEAPSQNFKALSLSNTIYAFLTFGFASSPFPINISGPGTYNPGRYNATANYAYQFTLVATGGTVANLWQFTTQTRPPYTLLSTTSLVTIDHAPNDRLKFTANTLTMSAISNVDFLTSYVTFNNRQAVRWDQGATITIDAHGGNWAYGEANILLQNPWNGLTYSIDWEPTCSLVTIRPNQQNLAINAYVTYVFMSGGIWYCKVFIQTATITGTGNAHDVPVTINVTLTPRVLLSYPNPSAVREDTDFSTLYGYSTVFSRLPMPEVEFSSITASTITIQAMENISFNAAVATPTFLGNGNIAVNAASNVDIMANYDVNIDAYDSVFVTGNSTITLTSYNPAVPPSYTVLVDGDPFPAIGTELTVINVLSDTVFQLYLADSVGGGPGTVVVSIPPGGTYTFTVASTIPNGGYQQVAAYDTGGNSVNQIIQNVSGVVSYYVYTSPPSPVTVNTGVAAIPDSGLINLTASTITLANYVDISGALFAPYLFVSSINANAYPPASSWVGTATSDLDMQSYKIYGSNIGNSLGNYQPLRFYYEPPTASGQSAEINITAHPADAGVIFSLRYGVDLAGGYGYLLCEWPGYIVVPMKIYGQDIALEGGETVHINANSGDATITATAAVNLSTPTINLDGNCYARLGSSLIRQPVIQYGTTTGSGTSGSATVTIPVAYASSSSYTAFAAMEDTTEAKMAVNRDSASQITIVWSQGGSGSHTLAWNTMGT